MERNQYLAVGVTAVYGGKQMVSASETDSNDIDDVYTPSHSFPVAKLNQPLPMSEEMTATTNGNLLKVTSDGWSFYYKRKGMPFSSYLQSAAPRLVDNVNL